MEIKLWEVMVQGQWGTPFDPEKLLGQETNFCLLYRKRKGRVFLELESWIKIKNIKEIQIWP